MQENATKHLGVIVSYEGYVQVLCRNGHSDRLPVDYGGDGPDYTPESYEEHVAQRKQYIAEGVDTTGWLECKLWKCDCGELMGWYNNVDDTNCDEYGKVSLAIVKEAEYETCNLGHQHIKSEAIMKPAEEGGHFLNGGLKDTILNT